MLYNFVTTQFALVCNDPALVNLVDYQQRTDYDAERHSHRIGDQTSIFRVKSHENDYRIFIIFRTSP